MKTVDFYLIALREQLKTWQQEHEKRVQGGDNMGVGGGQGAINRPGCLVKFFNRLVALERLSDW